jgi:hypothetical protein
MGQGSGTISIDGVVPASLATAQGGGWDWLDDTTCGGQAQNIVAGGFRLYQLVVPNTLTILDPVYNGGVDVAQQFRAGNGEWARFVAGGGVHTSAGLGLTLPLAALGDMDEDGLLAVVQNYASDNGLVTYAANGSTLQTVSTTVLAGTQRMRMHSGIVAYEETNLKWHLRDAATGALAAFAPRTDEVIATIVPVTISGTVWVVELSNTQLTLRPATSSNGFVISTSANIFFPDAVSLSAGTVRVGWSVTSGEGATQMRLADVTVSSGAQNTGTTASGALVITAGATIPQSAMPVGPVEGGSALLAKKQPRHAIKEDAFVGGATGKRIYQRWWELVAESASINLSSGNVTGVLPESMGGTGGTTGLSVLNGGNVIQDTTQLDTAQSFGPFVLATGRSQVIASPAAIGGDIQLDGTAELVVV